MKPARSVNDDHIRIFRHGGLDRVIGHGSGIRAHLLTDNADSGPVSPYLELLDGSSPECIGCTENHILSLRLEPCGELAYGRGLADTVDSHHEDDIRLFREIERKCSLPDILSPVHIEKFCNFIPEHVHKLVH